MLFSPDSQRLLLAGNGGLAVLEASSGRVISQRTGGRFRISNILGFESSTRFWTQSSYQGNITRLWDLSDSLGPRRRHERAGDAIQLRGDRGVLQWTDSLISPWTDFPAASPFPLSPIGERGFFRLKVEQ